MLQRETAKSAANRNIILITEAGPGFRAGAGTGFRIPLTGGHQIRADASYTVTDLRIYVCTMCAPVSYLKLYTRFLAQ